MPIFNVGFSEGGIVIPPCRSEAPTVEQAVEKAWLNNAATLERADATALGNGMAYRFRRGAGEWQKLAEHPVPELDSNGAQGE